MSAKTKWTFPTHKLSSVDSGTFVTWVKDALDNKIKIDLPPSNDIFVKLTDDNLEEQVLKNHPIAVLFHHPKASVGCNTLD